jgi:hypothetical protein
MIYDHASFNWAAAIPRFARFLAYENRLKQAAISMLAPAPRN